jgi:formate dehydrogenase subunit gamma
MPLRPDGLDAPARPGGEPSGTVLRFTTAERWVHRTASWLMLACIVTALFLYLPQLAELVGRRRLLVVVHEWCGAALPVPLALGLASRAYRADLKHFNRFTAHDRRWLRGAVRPSTRELPPPAGKFNAGQKLYAACVLGAVLVMLGTGLLMWFTHLAPLVYRTGATFVHDWLALLTGILVIGHIWMAATHPESRRAMRTGRASRAWSRAEHPHWDP